MQFRAHTLRRSDEEWNISAVSSATILTLGTTSISPDEVKDPSTTWRLSGRSRSDSDRRIDYVAHSADISSWAFEYYGPLRDPRGSIRVKGTHRHFPCTRRRLTWRVDCLLRPIQLFADCDRTRGLRDWHSLLDQPHLTTEPTTPVGVIHDVRLCESLCVAFRGIQWVRRRHERYLGVLQRLVEEHYVDRRKCAPSSSLHGDD